MKETQRLHELALIARREPMPSVDVADEVMASLRERSMTAPVYGLRPLAWIAAGTAVSAIPLAVAAIRTWQCLASPLFGLFLGPAGGLL